MKMRTTIIVVLLSLPLCAQNTPVPNSFNVSRPKYPCGTTGYRRYPPKTYLYCGVVEEVRASSLKVQAPTGGATTVFVVDEKSKIPQNLKPGARVIVDYGPTLETSTYRVLEVKPLGEKKFPKSKGPLGP